MFFELRGDKGFGEFNTLIVILFVVDGHLSCGVFTQIPLILTERADRLAKVLHFYRNYSRRVVGRIEEMPERPILMGNYVLISVVQRTFRAGKAASLGFLRMSCRPYGEMKNSLALE